MDKPTITNAKGQLKNKGGRPTKQEQLKHMDLIRPYWADGYSTHTAQTELAKAGNKFNVQTIQVYYREISNQIQDSKTKHYEEDEAEQKNRAISSIEKQTRVLVEHHKWLDQVITIEKIKLQLWKEHNLDEKGNVIKGADPPPMLRTHATAVCDITNSIADLRAMTYDIESAPTLTQQMEERIADKIRQAQATYYQPKEGKR